MRRIDFVSGIALSAASAALASPASAALQSSLRELEAGSGGRLGVSVLARGLPRISHRAGERFPMCSTFKVLAVAAVLSRVDAGAERLDRRVGYTPSDLLAYAPVTRANLHRGSMTLVELCAAAIELSDNTAANLLLRVLGGPSAVTRFVRSIGDPITRLDRTEPALNTAIPGDPRDTTTPLSMARDLQRVLLGGVLSASSRAKLTGWMVACKTGTTCLRAGFPVSWTAGDKTGLGGAANAAGDSGTRNDIAIAWPPGRAPLLVTAYLTGSQLPAKERDAVLAEVGRIVARSLPV